MLSYYGVQKMGTEIRTFSSLKELSEFLMEQIAQYKGLLEDYSQWLGVLLRDFESSHKDEEWFKKSTAMQKALHAQSKKPPEATKGKKSAKSKEENSCWVQIGEIAISYTEQGQTEILFEAIEKMKDKIQKIEAFGGAAQQLSRLGLGTTVNYVVYVDEDIPKKIVLKPKIISKGDETFKFATNLSVPAFFSFDNTQ
jgi:hypothetical protein